MAMHAASEDLSVTSCNLAIREVLDLGYCVGGIETSTNPSTISM